jgi:hypothetical protein
VIGFSGVVLNPGFTGSSGRMITLSFRAKTAGSAKLNFNSAQVLANDGLGTDILSVASSALVNIGQKKAEPVPVEPPITTAEEEAAKAKAAADAAAKAAAAEEAKEKADLASSTTANATGTGQTQAEAAPTSAIVLLQGAACTYEQLPAVFIKLGGLNFGLFGFLLILLFICVGIAIYAYTKARYLEGLEHQLHTHIHRDHTPHTTRKHHDA